MSSPYDTWSISLPQIRRLLRFLDFQILDESCRTDLPVCLPRFFFFYTATVSVRLPTRFQVYNTRYQVYYTIYETNMYDENEYDT